MPEIKITTEELWNEARVLSSIAVDIGRISAKNSAAINKMEDSCSFMSVAGIYAGANQLISRFSTLMQNLTRVATKAMNCAQAYEESNEELKKEFQDWFDSVEVNNVAANPVLPTDGRNDNEIGIDDLSLWQNKVSDAEYAKLCSFCNLASDSPDPIQTFIDKIRANPPEGLPFGDPLRDLTINQIQKFDLPSGLFALVIKDNNGNATVLFGGTNGGDFGDIFSDGLLATGHYSPQEIQANAIIRMLSNECKNITVSGHSLGGYLATSVALNNPKVSKCVAFDPPGRYDTAWQSWLNNNYKNITTYENVGSPISAVGFGVGTVKKLIVDGGISSGNDGFDYIIHHNIDSIFEALGGDDFLSTSWLNN